eukprot:CAMPEP_0174256726 /NCGR_PEP_ID=MMETSP0439-20130205/5930_1 /TAXON_ID=0 /ORGANISM="Stereomyxa ramosa, Strain Chinc5" /LENGTH=1000 /DNA_ID=CAMNT_0015339463 /DNA_START=275 /DNA_END=3277 /DNA_ORIENTATION=-
MSPPLQGQKLLKYNLNIEFGAIRGLVSKKKIRYMDNSFDLDLTYITDRIIAMGYPSEKIEGLYRNPFHEVVRFFETFHKGHYKIYNLCSERDYDHSKFHGPVERIPFMDHNCPAVEAIEEFCYSAQQWLDAHKSNVISVHCKAGKGRTGLMISAFLVYRGMWPTAVEALDFYGFIRCQDSKGVTIPSQIRFVKYFERLCNAPTQPLLSCYIKQIIIHTIPKVCKKSKKKVIDDFGVVFKIYHLQKGCLEPEEIFESEEPMEMEEITDEETGEKYEILRYDFDEDVCVCGSTKLEFFHKDFLSRNTKLFRFWIHSNFIDDQYFEISKPAIDDARKDKNHSKFDQNLRIIVRFSEPFVDSNDFIGRNCESRTADKKNLKITNSVAQRLFYEKIRMLKHSAIFKIVSFENQVLHHIKEVAQSTEEELDKPNKAKLTIAHMTYIHINGITQFLDEDKDFSVPVIKIGKSSKESKIEDITVRPDRRIPPPSSHNHKFFKNKTKDKEKKEAKNHSEENEEGSDDVDKEKERTEEAKLNNSANWVNVDKPTLHLSSSSSGSWINVDKPSTELNSSDNWVNINKPTTTDDNLDDLMGSVLSSTTPCLGADQLFDNKSKDKLHSPHPSPLPQSRAIVVESKEGKREVVDFNGIETTYCLRKGMLQQGYELLSKMSFLRKLLQLVNKLDHMETCLSFIKSVLTFAAEAFKNLKEEETPFLVDAEITETSKMENITAALKNIYFRENEKKHTFKQNGWSDAHASSLLSPSKRGFFQAEHRKREGMEEIGRVKKLEKSNEITIGLYPDSPLLPSPNSQQEKTTEGSLFDCLRMATLRLEELIDTVFQIKEKLEEFEERIKAQGNRKRNSHRELFFMSSVLFHVIALLKADPCKNLEMETMEKQRGVESEERQEIYEKSKLRHSSNSSPKLSPLQKDRRGSESELSKKDPLNDPRPQTTSLSTQVDQTLDHVKTIIDHFMTRVVHGDVLDQELHAELTRMKNVQSCLSRPPDI